MSETWRAIRPGGRMVVMNHFAAEGGPRAAIETMMEKFADWLGWRPKFPYSAVGDWIAAQPDAELVERRELAQPFKHHPARHPQETRAIAGLRGRATAPAKASRLSAPLGAPYI